MLIHACEYDINRLGGFYCAMRQISILWLFFFFDFGWTFTFVLLMLAERLPPTPSGRGSSQTWTVTNSIFLEPACFRWRCRASGHSHKAVSHVSTNPPSAASPCVGVQADIQLTQRVVVTGVLFGLLKRSDLLQLRKTHKGRCLRAPAFWGRRWHRGVVRIHIDTLPNSVCPPMSQCQRPR